MLPDGRDPHQPVPGRRALLLIFFLSGASGLIYQVVWNRGLVLVFGSTTHATSTVLAAFMGGLAAGSLLVGRRRGGRFCEPLRVYALLEAAIAVLSVAVLLVIPMLVPLYRLVSSGGDVPLSMLTGVRFVLACLVLLPPTALMGATLPILSAHLERDAGRHGGDARGAGAGALYAANTIGAVAG